jgi:hypothetical protein
MELLYIIKFDENANTVFLIIAIKLKRRQMNWVTGDIKCQV